MYEGNISISVIKIKEQSMFLTHQIRIEIKQMVVKLVRAHGGCLGTRS